MPSIGHETLLPIGTYVSVQNRFGFVVSAEMTQDIPCGLISFHMIRYTHKKDFVLDKATKEFSHKIVQIDEYVQGCFPAYIEVIDTPIY